MPNMPRNLGVSIANDGLSAWLCLMLCRIDGKSPKDLDRSSRKLEKYLCKAD